MDYYPHQYQQKFHLSKARYRTVLAGRRGGKTVAGAVESIIKSAEVTKWNDGDPYGVVIAPTFPMLRDIAVPELKKWGAPYIADFNISTMTFKLKNGFPILLRSADDPDKLRGLKIKWLWGDEVNFWKNGLHAWETIEPALTDYKGDVWLTSSTQGKNWVYRNFVVPADEGDPLYEYWIFPTIANPHIDKAEVERKRASKDPIMFRQEYEASLEDFIGQIYSSFKPSKHVIEPFNIPSHWRRVKAIDPGHEHGFGVVWLALSPDNIYYLYQDYMETGLTSKQNGINVKAMDKYFDEYFLIDPASAKRDQTSGTSGAEELRDLGFNTIPANNSVLQGIDRVHQLIREERLFVFSNCQKTVDQILSYRWDDKMTLDGKPRPIKQDDDLLDPLRYAVMHYWSERTEHIEPRDLSDQKVIDDFNAKAQEMIARIALTPDEDEETSHEENVFF